MNFTPTVHFTCICGRYSEGGETSPRHHYRCRSVSTDSTSTLPPVQLVGPPVECTPIVVRLHGDQLQLDNSLLVPQFHSVEETLEPIGEDVDEWSDASDEDVWLDEDEEVALKLQETVAECMATRVLPGSHGN